MKVTIKAKRDVSHIESSRDESKLHFFCFKWWEGNL